MVHDARTLSHEQLDSEDSPSLLDGERGNTRDMQVMIDKCELYVKSTPLLLKILGDKWRLPDAQVWY